MTLFARLNELWRYRDLVWNLVTRDLKVRYKDSILGVAWSWLNPLLMMVVYTVVFTFLAPNATLPDFHIFVLCAILPWNFFQDSVIAGTLSVVGNAHLIKKIYFPREVLPISVVLANLVNYLISLPVFFLLVLLSGARVTPWMLLFPLPLLIQIAFCVGIVLILATVNVFYRDMQIILGVLMFAWFFLSGIFYSINDLPSAYTVFGHPINIQLWLRRLNPMASIIDSYRDLLYWGTYTGWDFLLRTALTALAVLLIGYLVFLKFSPRFGEEL